MQGYPIQQNTAAVPLMFLMISSADHISGATGLSPTVTLSKAGAAFAAPAGAVTEVGSGWYKVAPNGTDSNTLGPLELHATATGADPADREFYVVAYNPLSATNLGLSALPTANPAASGGLPTVGTGAGQINPTSGKVPATLASGDVSGNLPANVTQINAVATTSVTTVGANIGTAQPVNFTGTSTSALVKVDAIDWNGVGVGGMPYSGTPPTTAAIATAVWQDLTSSSDFTTVGSVGKLLATNIDAAVSSRLATAGYSAPPSVASIATAVWQDATAGDFTAANSIGKALYVAAAPGAAGGLFIAGSNAATTVNITGNITGSLSGSVGSVTGSVGSVTGNVGGSVASVTAAVTVGGYSVNEDPATLVLGATAASWNTAGTIGHAINAAGTASDPWATALPGSYTAGMAGYIVGHNLDAAVSSRMATSSLPANFSTLSIDSNGNVKIQGSVKKNAALNTFEFLMVLSSDHVTPATGKTVTATRSLDGGAFAPCANAAAEVGGGIYKIDLAAGDLNANVVTLEFAAPGCDTTTITIVTQP